MTTPRRPGRLGLPVAPLLAGLLVAAPFEVGAQAIALTPLAAGLDQPTYVTHAGDGSGRLFITLQPGLIVIFANGSLRPVPFLDIRALVRCCHEEGLLSVAFHPQFAANRRFFVYYTNPNGDNVLARYRASAIDPDRADPESAQVLLTIRHPGAANHNGGQLQFGPDGYLYLGPGDGGAQPATAQDLRVLLGKLLRLDVDGSSPYGIPPDNPFPGSPGACDAPACAEIWASGLRNPWRFSFDRLTGDLFIADVGAGGSGVSHEEVSFQPAGPGGGRNYGWPRMEGFACSSPPTGCNDGSLTPPVLEYLGGQGGGRCAITGGYRYRGSQVPGIAGLYLFADFCTGEIFGTAPAPSLPWPVARFLDTSFGITSFGQDEAGELYVLHGASANGSLSRIVRGADGLTISPATGSAFTALQTFDLALVVHAPGRTSGPPGAILDGQDVTGALQGCAVVETVLPTGDRALRCPGLSGALLGAGTHTLVVTLDLSDGTTLTQSATWHVLPATEP